MKEIALIIADAAQSPIVTLEMVSLFISMVGVGLVFIRMWFVFSSKLAQQHADILIRLKEQDIRIMQGKECVDELKKVHDQDFQILSLSSEKHLSQLHRENREDHQRLFVKLESLSESLSGVVAEVRSHTNQNH